MTKTKKCHIERSRNAFEYDISNVFDLLRKLPSLKIYFKLVNAQTDIRYIINFCHILNHKSYFKRSFPKLVM